MAVEEGVSTSPRSWRSVAVLAGWLVLCVAPFVAGVLVPYYVNDLDALPLAELASGAHDPKDYWPQDGKDYWPQDGTVAGLVGLAGVLSLSLAPIGLLVVGAVSGTAAIQEFVILPKTRRAPRPVAVALLLVALVVGALLGWFLSPTASALGTWRLD